MALIQPSTQIDPGPSVAGRGLDLESIQAPVREDLSRVGDELRRIVVSDFSMIKDVNEHLLFLQGKLFRPTLLLLSSRVGGKPEVTG